MIAGLMGERKKRGRPLASGGSDVRSMIACVAWGVLLAALWLGGTGEAVPAQDGTPRDGAADAREMMRRIQTMAAGPHEVTELTMTLVDSTGVARHRETTIYQKQRANGRMARLTRFHTPPEMAGAGVLALENTDRDDDWWIYLPAYHTTRRIAARNCGDTYMGTDFSYEDLTDLRLEDHAFAILGWREVAGVRCRLLEVRPVAGGAREHSLYSRRVYFVDPTRDVYVGAVFYGRDGEPLKEVRNSEPVRIGDRWRWNRTEMRNLRTRHRTVLEVHERRWEDDLPDRIFSERSLRRPG